MHDDECEKENSDSPTWPATQSPFIKNAEPDAGLVPAEYNRDSFGEPHESIVAVNCGWTAALAVTYGLKVP